MPVILALFFNTISYYGTRFLTRNRYHYNLSNLVDDQIPFIPWMVMIYLECYVFWILNYILGCRQEENQAFRFMSADLAAKTICLISFLIIPTTNVRPVFEEYSIWESLVAWVYHMDAADNLFPSIHPLSDQLVLFHCCKRKQKCI